MTTKNTITFICDSNETTKIANIKKHLYQVWRLKFIMQRKKTDELKRYPQRDCIIHQGHVIKFHDTKVILIRTGTLRCCFGVQIRLALRTTFLDLFVDLSPCTLKNGSVIVSTFFTLQSQINITDYESSLMFNLFSVFLDAGFIFDNSSLGMMLSCCTTLVAIKLFHLPGLFSENWRNRPRAIRFVWAYTDKRHYYCSFICIVI